MPDFDFDEIFGEEEKPEPVVPEPIRPEHSYTKRETRVELPEPEEIRPKEKTPQEIMEEAAERARQQAEGVAPEQVSNLPVPHLPSPSLPGAREVTYSTPMELAQPQANAKGPWIQYNGVATVRIITRHDWAAAGVPSEKYCEWNYLNGKRLPRSMFSDEELQYLLRVDGRFSLETK